MQHPDEGMIHTWLDGELSQEEAATLEAHVAGCDQCRAAVAEARGFIAASSRIVGALDNVPSGVIPVAKPAKRMWYSSPQFRAAAAVLIVAGASLLIMKPVTQKSSLAISRMSEARTTLDTERSESASAPSVAAATAPTQPPGLADEVAKKPEVTAPKVFPAPPKGAAVLNAPAHVTVDAVQPQVALPKVANEGDFNAKGVKGGAVRSVDSAVLSGRISGLAAKAANAMSAQDKRFAPEEPELKIVHVDSSAFVKKTTYQSLSGKQVVLTEEPSKGALQELVITEAPRARKATAQSTTAGATAPVAPTPAAPVPVILPEIAVHTITWTDATGLRQYTLSGPMSVAELEAIKARLLKAKQ